MGGGFGPPGPSDFARSGKVTKTLPGVCFKALCALDRFTPGPPGERRHGRWGFRGPAKLAAVQQRLFPV